MNEAGDISVGIAGWSYDDWNGYVYPRGTKDKLRFIAGFVDMIEINSTFYRVPAAKTSASWVKRTADVPGFFFTAKVLQEITHRGNINAHVVNSFREGLAPLAAAGKLKHLLAQFRYDFADSSRTRDHLCRIRDSFADMANITFELRHRSWQSEESLQHLASLGVTVANLDYPLARNSFDLRTSKVGEQAYLRLHGRNSAAWFDRGAGRDETYNYCYSEDELEDIMDRAAEIAGMSTSLTLVANNHYQGKEVLNALELKAGINSKKVAVPTSLMEKYPRLRKIAAPPEGELDLPMSMPPEVPDPIDS